MRAVYSLALTIRPLAAQGLSGLAALALAACDSGDTGTFTPTQVEVTPPRLEFPFAGVRVPVTQVLTVRNAGSRVLTIDDVEVHGEPFSLGIDGSVLPIQLSGGDTVMFDVVFTPQSEDFLTGAVVLHSDDPADTARTSGRRWVALLPLGLDPILTVNPPARIDFGGVPFGSQVTRTVTIANTGGGDLWLYEVGMGPLGAFDWVTEAPTVPERGILMTPGNSFTLDIVYAPGSEWEETSHFWVSSNDPVNPDRVLALRGWGQ